MEERIIKAAMTLLEVMQKIEETAASPAKDLLCKMADMLETEIAEYLQEWKQEQAAAGMTIGQYITTLQPVIEILRKYVELKEGINSGTIAEHAQTDQIDPSEGEQLSFDIPAPQRNTELSAEIQALLDIADNDDAMLDDNPILKSVTRRNNSIANYGEAGKIKIIENSGRLNPFHAEVFNTAIKAYRNKKVTKDGYIVITENQAIKIMLGTNGTPSEKQKSDFRQAWEDMRNESMTYETTETLAQILGIEQDNLEDFIPGIKENQTNVVEEYFVQGLKIIKRQTVNGKDTDIYLIKPSDVVRKCLDTFKWYEEIEPTTQRVLKEDEEGNLKIWGYSKQRVKMR